MLIKSIPQRIKKTLLHELKDPYFRVFLILLVIGAFLRYYKIEEFITFLGDQGRDAIIMKSIAKLEHFPAVGAPSSIGMIFLGPFYYYLAAPWLIPFNFSPLGPAVGVATYSLIGTICIYFMVKDLFDKKVAILTTIFFLFCNVIVELSRFSWNPNLLSFFSLFSTYFLIKAIQSKRTIFFALAGLSMSFAMQLHYVVLALFLPFGLLGLWYIYKNREQLVEAIKNILALIGAFLLGSAPLIIFDVRHGYLNIKNFIDFAVSSKGTTSLDLSEVIKTFTILNGHLLGFDINTGIASIVLVVLALQLYKSLKHEKPLAFLIATFFLGLVVTSYFTQDKHPHYFGALYGIYFVILAQMFVQYLWKGKRQIALSLLLIVFLAMQSRQYYFLFGTPNYQIQKGERVAKIVSENVTAEKYHITEVPDLYGDYIYRYFLDLWDKEPLAKDSMERGTELFAICERECDPLSAPQWSIAFFEPKKIVKTWKSENVTIYKLIR